MSEIPIADPQVSERAAERVRALLETGELADGPEVRAFEREFSDACAVTEAVATANGTTAMHAALSSLGLNEGEAVITSTLTFVATAAAIRHAGGRPLFADIDPETYTIDPDSARRILERRSDVVGIVPVHLYGLPADMASLTSLAHEHDLFVLEDACQAHGATIDGSPVGSLGDAGCFSFYPTKNMTTGEGGIVTTDDTALADRIAAFVNHGRSADDRPYAPSRLGHNFRMTSLAAAIGRSQLEQLPAFLEQRRATAREYDRVLQDRPPQCPVEPPGRRHAYHLYTVRVPDRTRLRERLATAGIDTGVYYPRPLHQLPIFETERDRSLPVSERVAAEVVSLPVHPCLSSGDREAVCAALANHYK